MRKEAGAPRQGRIGLRCVFSRESVAAPQGNCDSDGSLNCHGYGSSVTVTATFGMVAAGEVLAGVVGQSGLKGGPRNCC